uniref:Uncharacterized protein n=1 Tax=Cacopsylla melanoneura TaxID=428564 RepID=A0A8D8ZA32_9HEMI
MDTSAMDLTTERKKAPKPRRYSREDGLDLSRPLTPPPSPLDLTMVYRPRTDLVTPPLTFTSSQSTQTQSEYIRVPTQSTSTQTDFEAEVTERVLEDQPSDEPPSLTPLISIPDSLDMENYQPPPFIHLPTPLRIAPEPMEMELYQPPPLIHLPTPHNNRLRGYLLRYRPVSAVASPPVQQPLENWMETPGPSSSTPARRSSVEEVIDLVAEDANSEQTTVPFVPTEQRPNQHKKHTKPDRSSGRPPK